MPNKENPTKTIKITLPHKTQDNPTFFDQYKMIAESLNNTNTVREISNGFWVTVNAIVTSSLISVCGNEIIPLEQKNFASILLLILGMGFCFAWLNYLKTIKKTVEIRNDLLIEFEQHLPVKAFHMLFQAIGRQKGKNSLTLVEMSLPMLFISIYIILVLGVYLYNSNGLLILPAK